MLPDIENVRKLSANAEADSAFRIVEKIKNEISQKIFDAANDGKTHVEIPIGRSSEMGVMLASTELTNYIGRHKYIAHPHTNSLGDIKLKVSW